MKKQNKKKCACQHCHPFLSAPKLRKPPLICNTLQLHLKLLAGKNAILSCPPMSGKWHGLAFVLICLRRAPSPLHSCTWPVGMTARVPARASPSPTAPWVCLIRPHVAMCSNRAFTCLLHCAVKVETHHHHMPGAWFTIDVKSQLQQK